MKTLYFDCSSGISGDMAIGALLDLGASRTRLDRELSKLGLSKEYGIRIGKGMQHQVSGTKFTVDIRGSSPRKHSNVLSPARLQQKGHTHGRTFSEIRKLIERSKLSTFVRKHAVSLFQRIAIAEGKVHNMAVEKVHFHEVGAIDSIIDIVGACILIEELGPDQILASPPAEGQGWIECAHGRLAVPVPATLELLKGIPFRQIDVQGELITPTGAGLLAEFVTHFCPIPEIKITKIGYGLGTKIFPSHPNVLRAILGEAGKLQQDSTSSSIDVLETNLDDTTPEILAVALENLLKAGARDAFFTPIQMKKGRPGVKLTVLSDPEGTQKLALMVLQETGSFGVRLRRSERICLLREMRKMKTRFGEIDFKVGSFNGKVISVKPEFESCRRAAKRHDKPVRIIWAAALAECSKLMN